MKDSIKANLIIFLIIAIIAFCISTSFANMTIKEDVDSYKLISIDNDSFEPKHIDEVPLIIEMEPENETNTTNATNMTNNFDNYTNYTDYQNDDFVSNYTEN